VRPLNPAVLVFFFFAGGTVVVADTTLGHRSGPIVPSTGKRSG
jgi:hypothetical protein